MKLSKIPVKGMKDILPYEMQVREYCLNVIKDTYKSYGYQQIDTPSLESLELLLSKQGGDNEKLIFKVLKRGEKLKLESINEENDLADSGLRYDLTVPLARFYSANIDKLITPFKALQIGNVWRADRPQKGRFRQFTQCDIDILGDSSILSEIDMLIASTTVLSKLGFSDFKLRISDRRILKAIALYCGIEPRDNDKLFIILDKIDKIDYAGVEKELIEGGFSNQSVDACLKLLIGFKKQEDKIAYLKKCLNDYIDLDVLDNLSTIIECVNANKKGSFTVEMDITLVRGMSYYTGTIFEIQSEEFSGAISGGGRYDEMISKFTGMQIAACGISIGFERIVTILMDKNISMHSDDNKTAILIEKGVTADKLKDIMLEAQRLRESNTTVLVVSRNKNVKHQKEQLLKIGYNNFIDIYKE